MVFDERVLSPGSAAFGEETFWAGQMCDDLDHKAEDSLDHKAEDSLDHKVEDSLDHKVEDSLDHKVEDDGGSVATADTVLECYGVVYVERVDGSDLHALDNDVPYDSDWASDYYLVAYRWAVSRVASDIRWQIRFRGEIAGVVTEETVQLNFPN